MLGSDGVAFAMVTAGVVASELAVMFLAGVAELALASGRNFLDESVELYWGHTTRQAHAHSTRNYAQHA